jgi:hypothetical protein
MTTQRQVERGTNPYVGPRALRRRDPLFGRDREARDLTDLLIAERIVLLHAPSGAGKTSLIQAGVVPRLEDEMFHVSGPLRLNGVRPDDAAIENRYLWSAVDSLLGDGHAAGVDDVTSLEEALAAVEAAKPEADHVIVLDQFEEVMTLDPPDWDGQEQFFRELGTALEREDRWALVSVREDYMGGLARYLRHLPSRLDVTFRLDFLERGAARLAMRGPAEERGVTFTDEATHLLAADLSAIRVQHPTKGVVTVKGPYVEPVQLQVVCETLWRRLERKLGAGFTAIEEEHVRGYGDLDRALGNFYADVVGEVARATGSSERALRDWFGTALITDARFRGQSSTGPAVTGVDVAGVLRELEDRYLIRSDERNATRWYELSHDRMVEPVLANNELWWIHNASRWELRADEWISAGRQPRHLLRGDELRYAKQWLGEHESEAGQHVRELIDASKAARAGESLRQRVSTAISILSILVVLQTILLIALLLSR